jgi:hypothetical protein
MFAAFLGRNPISRKSWTKLYGMDVKEGRLGL